MNQIDKLNTEGISVFIKNMVKCIIANTESVALRFIPRYIESGGDIDILTSPSNHRKVICNALKILNDNGCSVLKVKVKKNISAIYFMVNLNNSETFLLSLDIRTEIIKKGAWISNFESLKLKNMMILGDDGVYSMKPEAEAAFMLSRNAYDQRSLDPKHKEIINRSDETKILKMLDFFPVRISKDNCKGMLNLGEYTVHPAPKTKNYLIRYIKVVGKFLRPMSYETPKHIALIGPDGVGKTTVASGICERLSAFNKTAWLHYYQTSEDVEKARGVNSNNKKTKQRSTVKKLAEKSNLGILLSFFRFTFRTHLKIISDYKAHNFILHDRFLVDYFLKKNRNVNVPKKFADIIKVTPFDNMALQIILIDSPEAIRARKPELSKSEIEWVYEFVKQALPLANPKVKIVDIGERDGAEEVIEQCIETISNWIIEDFNINFNFKP